VRYVYVYKTSDGVRHEESIKAASREEVFETLRRQGIKAIKVVAADGSKANGEVIVRGIRKRIVVCIVVIAALVAGILSYRAGRSAQIAETSPRHWIENVDVCFDRPSERLLACFARPGVEMRESEIPLVDAAFVEDFEAALRTSLRIMPEDTPDAVELKRIVEGLKAEARLHLRGGRDYESVIRYFIQRQNTEAALRRQILNDVQQDSSAERTQRLRKAMEMLEILGFQPIGVN